MRRASIDTGWYLELLEDIDLIRAAVASGMGLKELVEAWDGVKYHEMQQFISHNDLKPESIPGMPVVKFNDFRDKKIELDGTTYCVHIRNHEPHIFMKISEYKKLMEEK